MKILVKFFLVIVLVFPILFLAKAESPAAPEGHQKETEKSVETESHSEPEKNDTPAAEKADHMVGLGKCISDQSFIDEMKSKSEKLKSRDVELSKREEEILKKEKAIEEKLTKIKNVRDEIVKMTVGSKQKSEENLDRLAETYEAMSPKVFAPILAGMENDLVVKMASKLSTEKMSKVLAQLDAKVAGRISNLIANQYELGSLVKIADKAESEKADEAREPASQ